MAGSDLSRSLMCHCQWNPEPPARVGVWGTGWPRFIPRQRWHSALLLNVGDTDQRQVEHELTSLWGEALNFSFSGEACLTKYKLLNHMYNELLQKLPRLQFPPKRGEPAFTDTGFQAQAFLETLCPSCILHPMFTTLSWIWTDTNTGLTVESHITGMGTACLQAAFYLLDHHVSPAFANVSATGMPWKGLISMHAVAAEHKYVWNSDHRYWNRDPEYKLGGF